MIVHPKGLSDELTYAIDQYVLNGGKVLVFVDANSEIDVAMNRGREGAGRSEFDKILNAWGVELVKDKVLGDLATARRVNVNLRGQTAVADYVVWLSLLPDNFSKDDAITGDLQRVTLASSGILKPIEGAATTLQPLVQSSEQSMELTRQRFAPARTSLACSVILNRRVSVRLLPPACLASHQLPFQMAHTASPDAASPLPDTPTMAQTRR